MRLLRINLTEFSYRAYVGKTERLTEAGRHTGTYDNEYAPGVPYEGQITIPSGMTNPRMFGLDANYTHILTMEDPETDIKEQGLIDWNGDEYEITAVRPSINYLSVALKKRTRNAATRTDGN